MTTAGGKPDIPVVWHEDCLKHQPVGEVWLPLRAPTATHGRVGMFCYDTMTLVGLGSWEAIRAGADCARTGLGANQNIPLAPGSGDEAWLDAVAQLCARAREAGSDAIVLSLGVDAAAADPESPLQVTTDGYRTEGALIGQLGPVAVIQEGGYDLASLGEYVLAALSGLQSATA